MITSQVRKTYDVSSSTIDDVGLPINFLTSNPSTSDVIRGTFSFKKFILRKLIGWGILAEDPCCSSGIFPNSITTGIVALGTTQATAVAITAQYNQITTSAANTGVILPTAKLHKLIQITSNAGANIDVYPPVGGTIDGGTVNAGTVVADGKTIILVGTTNLNYNSITL